MNSRFALWLGFLPACIAGAALVKAVEIVTGRDLIEEAKPGGIQYPSSDPRHSPQPGQCGCSGRKP